MTINCRGKLIDLSSPKVMGILNITPDSFHDGGKYLNEAHALQQVEKLLAEGADFIDVGGMSSRPGAEIISEEEEIRRVLPVVESIVDKVPEAIISVDTIRSRVAKEALQAGAHIINDISAGRFDQLMMQTLATFNAPYIIMHMQGLPADMQVAPKYNDVVNEVYDFFVDRINACRAVGITDTILDPGFGFGKTVEHNYSLLRSLDYFANLRLPILAGVSRKSMVCKVLGVNADNALNGTTAVNMLALMNGSQLLRVHDVKEAKEAIKIFEAYKHS